MKKKFLIDILYSIKIYTMTCYSQKNFIKIWKDFIKNYESEMFDDIYKKNLWKSEKLDT